GRPGASALLQPAQVLAGGDREERPGHHRQEPADRHIAHRPGPAVLVLASASPRRRELLGRLGVAFEIHPSHIPEEHPPVAPAEAIAAVALAKALAVAAELAPAGRPAVILGADTEIGRAHV